MKYHILAEIISNKKIVKNYYKLVIKSPEISSSSKPCQLISILLDKTGGVFLRRPFSISQIKKDNIYIIYKVVGKGTEKLSRKRNGEMLDIIGPLGNKLSEFFSPKFFSNFFLGGGGYGISPLLFLSEYLIENGVSPSSITVLIGAKSKEEILCEYEFKKIGCRVFLSTEDGSKGLRGNVVDLLEIRLKTALRQNILQHSAVFACGPKEMLKKIGEISRKYKSKCYVILEEIIACGVGACLGCAVKVKDASGFSYKMVCSDGPVFDVEDVLW